MSETKKLLDALLCDIYGRQELLAKRMRRCCRNPVLKRSPKKKKGQLAQLASGMVGNRSTLERLDVRKLIDVCAILKVEILMLGYLLERVLVARDRLQRHQEVLCEFVTAVLVVESDDAQPKMRFSLSPPPQKAITSARLTSPTKNSLSSSTTPLTTPGSNNRSPSSTKATMLTRNGGGHGTSPTASGSGHAPSASASATAAADDEATSDYNQWLHAMKLVARLPGGTPPEFRRKLWLSLADKYLKSKNVDWAQQREKCFCEEWREDDEELGIQIVKDLHRTGSNLCTGPAGSINQAKLKRILLGYARYNPEVGYCQGFNMLGALILQVMDKEEEESMKVMIYLVEGVLPTGYFYGSMGGLQADMGVFRELMQTRLPRLAKHLQRLQGPVENAFEPPLTNVFTMQWFLTMFCTCLPMSCVLRVWDLVLIEGSDVLLRTALVLWSLLEERVISVRSADEFYGKMGSYSSELLNGHLVDSNGLIERVVKLGPIADLRQLRDKHLYNIAPLRHKQGLQLYYDEEDTHSDEERLAVATVFGLNWGRRGSVGPAAAGKQQVEQKDRLALDISLLKKQYDRLRERQKQAHVILTTACSTAARQGSGPASSSQSSVPVNQLLLGRPAIVTNKGKRVGAPLGAIPPARKPSLPAVLHTKPTAEKQLRRGETLLWRDTDPSRRRRDSLTWKEIKADRAAMMREGADVSSVRTQKLRTRFGKSDSSSYSEDSDGEQETGAGGGGGSSTDTSLCDDDDPKSTEKSPKQKAKLARKLKEQKQLAGSRDTSLERQRPKSWAPSSHEIPFMLMGTDSGDEKEEKAAKEEADTRDQAEDSATESGHFEFDRELHLVSSKIEPLKLPYDSEIPDIPSVSPIPTPREKDEAEEDLLDERKAFDVSDDGVTNQYFERVNSVERPNRLELSYSLNEEETDTNAIYLEEREKVEGHSGDREYNSLPRFYPREDDDGVQGDGKVPQIRDDNIPASALSNASRKRRDPRRKTLTRSSTIEIEERYQALERRISQEQPSGDRTLPLQAKYIPSTAALEERFNTLEKQLSAEKQRKEQTDMDADYPVKPERIPSTADLESRFNSLTKQMSSSESSSKTPIDLKDEDRPSGSSSKKQKDSEKTSKLHQSEEPESNTKESTEETETSDSKEVESDEKKAEQPRLKKLPSTAELEDRFNALERKMSVQKSSPSKNKKEPPDEGEPKSTKEPEKPEESEKEIEKSSGSQSPMATKDPKDSDQKKPETKETTRSPTENQDQKVKDKSPKSEESVEKETSKSKEDSQESETKKVEANQKLSLEKGNNTVKEKREEAPEKSDKETAETKNENVENDSSKKSDSQKKEASKTSVPEAESESKPASKENSTTKDVELEKTPRKSPPSTEELEKRFNALEKQMSTTNLETTKEPDQTKSATKSQSSSAEEKTQKSMKSFDDKIKQVNVAIEKEQKRVEVEDPAAKKRKNVEESGKVVNNQMKTPKTKEEDSQQPEGSQQKGKNQRRASEPPSTEDLEKRYETLKRRMSSKNQFSETVDEALERIQQEVISESVEEKKPPPSTEDLESRFEALQGDKKNVESKMSETKHVDVAIEAHIPSPPPPPPPPKERPVLAEPVLHQQQALIEELQSKMRGQSPGEENLKPSEINPQRRQRKLLQRPTPMGDETSEAPANTAYYRAANHEQWQQRMVRRFSDLPSRADLENRLQFLERQLYKKFYKQRCASDSEVASRVKLPPEDQPSTSRQAKELEAEGQLEQRVLALEKQLSENSLKLLEAMRERQRSADDSGSPRRLSTETIDATGKELVRYTQNIGELEEVDAHKPINISINIKMLVNKDNESKQPKAESKPTTEDLTRRLEQLEQQLLEERAKNGSIPPENEVLEEKPEKLEEKDSCKKQEKNCHNQHVKGDEVEKAEVLAERKIEPAAAKETKTLENEEKAQARAKDVDTQKSVKGQNVVDDTKSVNDQNVVDDTKSVDSQKAVDDTKSVKDHNLVGDKRADGESLDKKDKSPAKGKSEDDIKQKSEASKAEVPKETSTQGKPSETKLEKRIAKDPVPKEASTKEASPKRETLKSEEPKSKEKEATKTETNKSKETSSVPVSTKESKVSSKQLPEKKETIKDSASKELPEKMVIDSTDVGPMDANGKTVVLLMDNEHRASKVRRLTRANTEELEDLFQALEKQLNDRNLVKSEDGRLIRVDPKPSAEQEEQTQAISDLTKQIEDFTSAKPEEENPKEATKDDKPEPEEPEDYDWGPNTVKHHLKRKTVYLPSTKELESRFRSLERQIKLLEDVEKIDVEQRLSEIERKIKLQYSLSHEKDLNKYLELCEGKGLDDDEPLPVETPTKAEETTATRDRSRSPGRRAVATKSPYTSPSRKATIKTPHTSPTRKPIIKSPYTSPSRKSAKSPYTSPSRNRQRSPSPTRSPERKPKRSPYTSPARRKPHPNDLPISDDLEYKYRVLDLVRSKSKENLAKRMNDPNRKPAIHPLEMILSPSPDTEAIPTTGELEHRIRVLDEKLRSPAKTRSKSRSRSPTIEDIKRQKMRDEQKPRTPVHNLERIVSSPGRPEPPTAEELEERIRILEQEHKFDFKTQKDYKAFNQKLKDVISPSLSFDEFRAAKSREQSPRRHGPTTPKSALRRDDFDEGYCGGAHTTTHYRPTSPKVIRFRDEDENEDEDQFEEAPRPKSRQTSDRMVGSTHDVLDCLEENTKILQRILKKTLADQPSATRSYASSSEGLDALGSRLMRETSPITRTGTHTGVPLRTGENINDRLSSIKNSIKSIDTLCEEKPYQKEKCQRYIDSLFTDSLHFASKKSSLEDLSLSRSLSRSESRGRSIHRTGDYAPSIRVTSEHRSLGSADSRRSPLGNRDTSPVHHRSHRDVSRELSPRRRRLEEEDEERKDRESSRVRRDNLLPNYFADNRSELSSGSSLTGFNHKVDRQLEETCAKYADDRRSACRTPLSHPYESRTTATRHSHTDPVQIPAKPAGSATATDSFPRPVSPYRQPYDPYHRSPGGAGGTPLYQPGKLEIRHTTVTSTFYDRFLTEKQIERQTHSRPPSRSPVVSPSVPAKSYVDLSSTTSATSSTTATSTTASSFMSSSYAGPSFSLPSASNYSYLNPVSGSGSGSGISSISPRASCSDLRSTTSGPTSTSTTSATTSSYVPYNFTSSFTSRLSDPSTTSTASAVSTSSLTHSTGVYNPMMSFTLREPLASSSLGGASASTLLPFQFNRTFTSNFDKEQNKQ
ncbi:microtubule-associated protein futsch isoform X4 [Drosophila teissieri]|uniref:microtubule-associated protein futsch isoform X4 n=1 Tax=Drosophila teissieri TaxID=7243 RepID=UPI001CBA1CA7|nr:microtubule-associated protein futsch isoform X4 [Drosophila teissieri]